MVSVFVVALLAFAPSAEAPALSPVAALDLRCYGLMAQLAEDEDPRIRAAGVTGAQYFLGRIDAASPEFDPDQLASPPVAQGERERLVSTCGGLMGAGGRDFRTIGQRLARPDPTI